MIDAATIAHLRALEAAATKGPWTYALNNPDRHPSYGPAYLIPEVWEDGHGSREDAGIDDEANAALIAAMRNALPGLLAALEAEDNIDLNSVVDSSAG